MASAKKRATEAPTGNVGADELQTQIDLPNHNVSAKLVALAVFICALAGYLATLARTVTLVDSGELILTSAKLGVAHPPGFPLYTLLGYIFSKLPIGSVAMRISLMSSVFAAITAALLALIALEIRALLRQSPTTSPQKKNKTHETKQQSSLAVTNISLERIFVWLMPIAVGLTLAFSVTLWFYAAVAEVYTLNLALLAIISYLMLCWYRSRLDNAPKEWLIPVAAAVYGLALGVHHVTILLTLPAFAWLVWRTAGWRYFLTRPVWLAFVTVLAGLLIYLYLPLSAARQPVLNWGNPASWQRFYWHISAKQYQVNLLSTSVEQFQKQLAYFFNLLVRQFTPLGLVFLFLGLITLWQKQRTLFGWLVLIVFFDVGYGLFYDIAEDKDAYYLTTNFALAIAIGAGAKYLFDWAYQRGKSETVAILLLIVSLPILNFSLHYFESNKRNYLIAHDFVENTLRAVQPGGLLLTLEWQFYSPYLYLRHVENFRTDAVVVDVNLLRRSWYIEGYLSKEYPEMMQACAAEKTAFLEYLSLFEHGQPYDTARINQRFIALINSFIKYKVTNGAAYVTLPMEPGVATDYNWVPQGLTMRLYQDQIFHPEAPELQLRGLLDNSVFLDEVARGKLLRTYATMYTNRGRYLAAAKQFEQAIEHMRFALQLDGDFDPAYEFLGDIYRTQLRFNDAQRSYQQALAINPNNKMAQKKLLELQTQTPPLPANSTGSPQH